MVFLASQSWAAPRAIEADHEYDLREIMVDDNDRFYLDYGRFVDLYQEGTQTGSIRLEYDTDFQLKPSDIQHQVTPDGSVHSVYTVKQTDADRGRTSFILYYSICASQDGCDVSVLKRYRKRDNNDYPDDYSFSRLEVAPNGQVFVSLNRKTYVFVEGERESVVDRTYFVQGESLGTQRARSDNRSVVNRFYEAYDQAFDSQALAAKFNAPEFFGQRSKLPDENNFWSKGELFESEVSPRYDRTPLRIGSQGYIVSHDSKSRGLFLTYFDAGQVYDYPLDRAESGHSHFAFTSEKEIWIVHYFFRDVFNQGLLVTVTDENGIVRDQFPLHLSTTRSVGLNGLHGARSSGGSVILAYDPGNGSDSERMLYFPDVESLRLAADTFANEGHPLGREFAEDELAESADARERVLQAQFQSKKSIRLTGTVGLQYQFRHPYTFDTLGDEPDEPAFGPDDRLLWDLDSAASLVQIIEVEGGVGGTSFGGEFLSEQADILASESSGVPQAGVRSLKGWLGWDKLFMNYDVGLGLERSSYDMAARDRRSNAVRETEVTYTRMYLYLLSLKSNRFGLDFETYNTLQPANLYKSPRGRSSYSFDRQDAFEAQVYNLALTVGRSSLDHMAKYSSSVNRPYLDIHGRIGLGVYQYGEHDSGPSATEFGLVSGLEAEAGWALLKRFGTADGLGGMLRVGYRVNGSMTGSRDPDSRESESDESDVAYDYSRVDLMHGPILRLSLVY